jgi:hypothetical protein
VAPMVHLFSQSSLQLDFIICLVVSKEVDVCVCVFLAPLLTRVSVLSCPGILECHEIHCITSLMLCVLIRLSMPMIS